MKIGLIGYGKMGKVIERIALERGHTIVFKANSASPFKDLSETDADVAIEFTQPDLAEEHMKHALELGLPIVVGTTGWYERLSEIETLVNSHNGSLLHASNFSIGAELEEIHHVQKLDAPSGTAISIAQGIIKNHDSYSKWNSSLNEKAVVENGSLPITAIREPEVPGTHTVTYNSAVDLISMSHIAHNRDGFALGSVLAAEFLFNKKGIYTMNDVLSL
jgi:4-hydroxy-tetrahydrodipicolinate reductase